MSLAEQEIPAGRAEPPPTFSAQDLRKSFGGLVAVGGVTLHVAAGEVVALMGDNGAGKSTLMRCIAGEHIPDSGVMKIDGAEVSFRQPSDARASGVETVYQDLALADDLTVTANLFLGREETRGHGLWRHLDNRRMHARAAEIIEQFGISVPSVRAQIKDLSGGQRQGVAIGRAVGWGTKLVLLDEPTAALGVREREHVAAVINGLGDSGIAVLIVSHQVEEVFKVADRIYVLRHGQLVGHFAAHDVTPNEVVAAITGVDQSTVGH